MLLECSQVSRNSSLDSARCLVRDPRSKESDKSAVAGVALKTAVPRDRDEAHHSTDLEAVKLEPDSDVIPSVSNGRRELQLENEILPLPVRGNSLAFPMVYNQSREGMLSSDLSLVLSEVHGARYRTASRIAASLIPIVPVPMMTIPQPMSLGVLVPTIPEGMILGLGAVPVLRFMS